MYRQIDGQTGDKQMDGQIDGQRHIDEQIDRQMDRQTDIWTDRQIDRQMDSVIPIYPSLIYFEFVINTITGRQVFLHN